MGNEAEAWIRWLDEPSGGDNERERQVAQMGGKGANLWRLMTLGLPVPRGFVITTAAYRAFLAANKLESLVATDSAALPARIAEAPMPGDLGDAILDAYQQLGAGAVAVRSSGTAEDLAAASFAGQHDTFLDISGSQTLLAAVQGCWASLWTPRAIAYRRQNGWEQRDDNDDDLALAVVVQLMAPATAAGVAFTANPVTGDRAETTISAVRGLGERLVSGVGVADEWVVRGVGRTAEVTCRRGSEHALTAEQARAVAALARRIEGGFGAPQDMEWAIDANGKLFVLQARPMTALPEPVTWRSPVGGGWMRNFRLGEWLPEPVTPLCESWLLARIEDGEIAAEERDFGIQPRPPYHVLANGWYFSSPVAGGLPLSGVATALTRHPAQIAALALSTTRPDIAERLYIVSVAHRWQMDLLPRYQHLVAFWEDRLDSASPAELVRAVDEIAGVAGEYLWAFSVVGGHAWKAEHALARFCHRRLPDLYLAARGHQELLLALPVTLPAPYPEPSAHAVQSLDWIRPTVGEAHSDPMTTHELSDRRTRMAENRRAVEAACRRALAGQPKLRRRFDGLLSLAQRYAILREEQAGWFTLGWPVMRCAVLQLGEELRARGVVAHADDVFFLTHDEVESYPGIEVDPGRGPVTAGNLLDVTATRRREWERQRRLSPPLVLGHPLGARVIARAADTMRVAGTARDDGPSKPEGQDMLKGMPASPGRATGPVRIIRGPEDFERFQPGEVLVAQVTAPAWTALFGRAAAVVTDGGSLAAHASLVAREYGIPAVVGAGDATARLRDGQRITVDGNAGIVTVVA